MSQQQYVDLIKSSLLQALKKSVMISIIEKVPFLGNFFFGPFTGMIVSKILEIAINAVEMQAFFLYTDMRVTQQGKAFEQAAIANQQAQKSGDANAKKIAEDNLIKALRDLVKLGN